MRFLAPIVTLITNDGVFLGNLMGPFVASLTSFLSILMGARTGGNPFRGKRVLKMTDYFLLDDRDHSGIYAHHVVDF